MPAFSINGEYGFAFGYSLGINSCNCPLFETENHFQWVSNWTKISGTHTFGWGADLRRAHRSGELSFDPSTTGNFDADSAGQDTGQTTGAGIASLIFGVPDGFARYFTGANLHPGLRQTRLFFYAQDTWRATAKLTLSYGLRYENYLPQNAASPGGAGSFDPSTGEVLIAGVGSVSKSMNFTAYKTGFVPRIGIAYQVAPKTVLRAGYGSSFTPAGLGAVFGQAPDYDPPVILPQYIGADNSYA
jgi:outer membrane receptor protein involved in Fe transport